METKEFRNALIANIKQELKDWTKTQRDLKKTRKEEFRPKDKEGCYGLQSILDEINGNRGTITNLHLRLKQLRFFLLHVSQLQKMI